MYDYQLEKKQDRGVFRHLGRPREALLQELEPKTHQGGDDS